MEAHFHHWIKNKKGSCDFLSHKWYKLAILTFFLRIVRYKCADARYKLTIMRKYQSFSPLRIGHYNWQLSFYLTILRKKSELWDKTCNSDFITRNCGFISHNSDFYVNSQLWEKSQNYEISRNYLFLLFIQWWKYTTIEQQKQSNQQKSNIMWVLWQLPVRLVLEGQFL